MTSRSLHVLLSLLPCLTSCAVARPAWEQGRPDSEEEAAALLARSVAAVQGPAPLELIEVDYEGEWGFWVQRIQPLVTDPGYRQTAVDRLWPAAGRIEQVHSGPKGDKHVVWDGEQVRVSTTSGPVEDPARLDAAALVAEAYQLFLLGPRYLEREARELRMLEPESIAGTRYERLVARLTPGLGNSPEDFVVLWVEAESGLPFRVHFTLEGFEGTRGAHADTTYLEWIRLQGHAFPSEYVERVRGPLRLHAHDWRIVSLELR